jgi:hypothetical protein
MKERLRSSRLLSSIKLLWPLMCLLVFYNTVSFAVSNPQDELTPVQLEAFKSEAKKKTSALENYIRIIVDKSQADPVKSRSIALALKLFVDDKQLVQVSSVNTDKIKNLPIRQYLNNLMVLPYKKIDIKWFDVAYVRDFKKGQDGRYYAVLTVFQEYRGFSNEGKLIYKDITQKELEVVLDKVTKRIGDVEVKEWDVLLRGIRVVETR